MSVTAEQAEVIYDFCDLRTIAMMFGATSHEATEWISPVMGPELARVFDQRKTRAPVKLGDFRVGPRLDWSKATPRLPEKEWLPLTGQIYRRDGYICTYCGDEDAKFCIDHVVPLSRGGSNDPSNLVVACMPCNSSKGFKLVSEWRGRYQ